MTIYSKSNPPAGSYVYAYLREDGTPYYIGKGSRLRAWKHYTGERIKQPTDDNRIVILEAGLTDIDALTMECALIQKYGRKDLGTGVLRNITAGGEGTVGAIRSAEWKLLASARLKGKPGITRGMRLRPQTEGTKRKRAESNTGLKRTPEQNAARSLRQLGKKIGQTGPQTQVVCPQCGKMGGGTGMKKWHFENCGAGPKTKIVCCPHCAKEGGENIMHRWHFDNCPKRCIK